MNGLYLDEDINGFTLVHGQATEEREDVFDGLLGGYLGQKRGKGVCDEYSMKGGFTPGKEINLFEGAEALVIEGKIDGQVHGGKGIIRRRLRGGSF